jgi:hypothetical protein
MIRQARAEDTVLVTEMTDRTKTLPWWVGGEEVKTTENKIHRPHCPAKAGQKLLAPA